MIKRILTILLSCLAYIGYAQESSGLRHDLTDPRHALTIEPANLLLRTISVSYSLRMNDRSEFRINPKISFPFSRDNLLLNPVEDPFWYYTSYTLQVGFSKMFGSSVYIEPMFFGRYASFEDRTLQTKDSQGDHYDEFETLDRKYYASGFILRSGVRSDKAKFRFNFFYGLGFNIRYYEEDVKSKYDAEPTYWKAKLSLQVGFEIGPRF